MFPLSNIYITRKCSLKCPHCMIWRTHRKEIPPYEWIKIITTFLDTGMVEHVSILGGEPLEYWKPIRGLYEVIKGLGDRSYSIVSNSLLLTYDWAKKFVEAGLRTWIVSIDYPYRLANRLAKKDPRAIKAYRVIDWFEKLGMEDINAIITVYPSTYKYLPEIVDDLMDRDVWIEITFALTGKGKYDSFPALKPANWNYYDVAKTLSIVLEKLKNYKKWHGNYITYHRYMHELIGIKPFKCGKLLTPVVDEDGYMRLCRDIAGKRVRKWHALEIVNNLDKFISDWMEDYKELCEGCNWNCVILIKDGYKNFTHL